jgi:hypothetical protein
MIRLPGSMTSRLNRRTGGGAPGVAIRFRLISLVPIPSGTSEKAHTQLPSSELNTRDRLGSSSATRSRGPRRPRRCASPN